MVIFKSFLKYWISTSLNRFIQKETKFHTHLVFLNINRFYIFHKKIVNTNCRRYKKCLK